MEMFIQPYRIAYFFFLKHKKEDYKFLFLFLYSVILHSFRFL